MLNDWTENIYLTYIHIYKETFWQLQIELLSTIHSLKERDVTFDYE